MNLKVVVPIALGALSTVFACSHTPQRTQVEPATVRLLWPALYPPSASTMTMVSQLNASSHQFHLTLVPTEGSGYVVEGVQQRMGDVGLAQSDLVYTAYRRGTTDDPHPYQNLRGVAVGRLNRVFVLVRRDSSIASIRDLRGRHITVSPPGTGGEPPARMLLSMSNLSYADLEVRHHYNADMMESIEREHLDAMILVGSYDVKEISEQARVHRLRPIPVDADAINRLRADYPFFRPVQIEWHTDTGVEIVNSMGTDSLVIARTDLAEPLVYELTRALNTLGSDPGNTIAIDTEKAPATPIPLHPGAARYYRELQLLR